jgi:hypothetical protein
LEVAVVEGLADADGFGAGVGLASGAPFTAVAATTALAVGCVAAGVPGVPDTTVPDVFATTAVAVGGTGVGVGGTRVGVGGTGVGVGGTRVGVGGTGVGLGVGFTVAVGVATAVTVAGAARTMLGEPISNAAARARQPDRTR